MHAAHSSSRSRGSPSCSPRRGELVEHAQRQRRHVLGVLGVDLVLRGHVQHARAPHVGEQRLRVRDRRPDRQQALEEHALAQPRLGRLQGVEAARAAAPPDDHRARQDQVGARGLDARHARALGRGQRRQPLHELGSARARSACPARRWTAGPPRAGRPPRGCARCRRCPPAAAVARRPPRARATRACASSAATCSRSSSSCLRLAGPLGGRKRSLMRTVPSGHEPSALSGARHAHQLQRAAAQVEHAAVAQRGRVDRRQIRRSEPPARG